GRDVWARAQVRGRRGFGLPDVTGEAIRLLGPTLRPRVELAAQLDADTPEILGDATQIHQLLLNLCTNASQAMPAEGGRIGVRVSRGEAALSSGTAGSCARLSVSDSGGGVAPALPG